MVNMTNTKTTNMKTQFQHDEIKKLLISKWDELQGETILSKLQVDETQKSEMGFSDGLNKMYNLGKNHGVIEGQMKFLSELMDFFEIQK
jgi:hypothetical protein